MMMDWSTTLPALCSKRTPPDWTSAPWRHTGKRSGTHYVGATDLRALVLVKTPLSPCVPRAPDQAVAQLAAIMRTPAARTGRCTTESLRDWAGGLPVGGCYTNVEDRDDRAYHGRLFGVPMHRGLLALLLFTIAQLPQGSPRIWVDILAEDAPLRLRVEEWSWIGLLMPRLDCAAEAPEFSG